jgi:NTE family protein
MEALGVTSKFNAERGFLEHLKADGRACAGRWLEAAIDDLGVRSSVDIRGTFL